MRTCLIVLLVAASACLAQSPLVVNSTAEALVRSAYQHEFALRIPHPAFYDNSSSTCANYPAYVSTAYLPAGSGAKLYTIYLAADGSVIRSSISDVYVRPAGAVHVLTLLIRYPETVSDNGLAFWEDAQKQINHEYQTFAVSRGLDRPIVVFDNTNVPVERGEIQNPHDPASVRAAAIRKGKKPSDYQIVTVIDLNPIDLSGGLSRLREHSIYVGNYSHWNKPLDASQWRAVAQTAYYHEMAHHFGWPGTHDWAPKCGGGQADYAPFIVPPVLFGWEDLQGDGGPEILSKTPYGRGR